MSILEVTLDGDEPRRFPIGAGPILIGRDASCDVRIEDPAVQPRHATLSLEWCLRAIADEQPIILRGRRVTRDWIDYDESFAIGSAGRVQVRLRPGIEGLANAPSPSATAPVAPLTPPAKPAEASATQPSLGEVEALRRRVRELESERADLQALVNRLESELDSERERTASATSVLTEDRAADWIESLRLPEPLTPAELERLGVAGIEGRLRLLLEVLLEFVERLERTTDRVVRATSPADASGLFDHRSLRGQLARALRAPSDHHARAQFDSQIQFLQRAWVTGTLRVYRTGVEEWAQSFLNRIAPKTFQIRAGISDTKLDFGLGYKTLWFLYRDFVLELTAPVLVEEIDEAVQRKVPDLR